MKLDITIHKGRPDKPAVIFIHGLGMEKSFWTDPANTKVFAKNIPMKVFAAVKPGPRTNAKNRLITVGDIPEKIIALWDEVIDKGFNAVCWSQRRPVGPISSAIEELGHVVKQTQKTFPGCPLALIGHSRGGLVARKFMEDPTHPVKALITIASPHEGSSLSRIGKFISPLSPVIKKLLPLHVHGTASDLLKRASEIIEGTALKELLPGSDFFNNLNDRPRKDIKYMSFGGTTTKLITIYSWQNNGHQPKPLLTVPDSLVKFLPSSMIPDELTPGKGDFMVTAKSSVLPWASRHYDLPANHISIIWHKKTINHIIVALEEI